MINTTQEKLEEFIDKLKAKCEERGQTQIDWGFIGPVVFVRIIIDGLMDSYCIYNLPNGTLTFDRIWNGVL